MHTQSDYSNPGGQVDDLIRMGMQIPGRESALNFVRYIGADVLREYLPPFQCHGRFDGAQFADVADLFAFDGDLRMLVMAAAGLVEISLRAQMAAHGVLPAAQADKKAATMGGLSWHYWENLTSALRR